MSLNDHELQVLANALEDLTISWRHLLYPYRWPMPQIPHERYHEKSSKEAIDLAAKILAIVHGKIYQ